MIDHQFFRPEETSKKPSRNLSVHLINIRFKKYLSDINPEHYDRG